MSRPRQSALERFFFEKFSKMYPNLPAGDIAYGDKPDVVIHGDKVYGVEIANVYLRNGSDEGSEQIQAKRRAQVIAQAQEHYRSSGNPRLEFWVDFDPGIPIRSVADSAKRLAFIAEINTCPGSPFAGYKPELDFPELRYLAHNGIVYSDAKWQLSQIYEVPNLSVSRVREIVSEKVVKVSAYAKCDLYWLLLVIDFWDPAQDQALHWPAGERIGATPFERILVFKPGTREYVEVPQ